MAPAALSRPPIPALAMADSRSVFEPETRAARRRGLRQLERRLGHVFSDLDLLDRALCHSSTGNDGKQSYERLEQGHGLFVFERG